MSSNAVLHNIYPRATSAIVGRYLDFGTTSFFVLVRSRRKRTMAPSDPWLAGRHFGIVIDAGSSGSRLQIYSWKDPKSLNVAKGSPLAYMLPKVEKGTQNNEMWVSKVEPGGLTVDNLMPQSMLRGSNGSLNKVCHL